MRDQKQRVLSLFLALTLLLSLAACGGNKTAATMHLRRTEGTVSVSDGGGKDVPVLNNLGLYSGYGVGTSTESYAWIDLDDVKLAKLDQDSEIAIQKEGKALDIEVKSGSLFFNVTEPLADDETMNISVSTMLVGIRGTCGWVENLGSVSRVYLLEGKAECSAGEQTVQVNAGEFAELTTGGKLTVKPFTAERVAAFVRPEIEDREELTADLPVSRFKNTEEYVEWSEISPDQQGLLRRLLNAAKEGNWEEAGELVYATYDWESIAGGHEYILRGSTDGLSDRGQRDFRFEYDGYRVRITSWITDLTEPWGTGLGLQVNKSGTVDIRPESGTGYYMIYFYGRTQGQPASENGIAVGQCENYNWTGSFELNDNGYGNPALSDSTLSLEYMFWND